MTRPPPQTLSMPFHRSRRGQHCSARRLLALSAAVLALAIATVWTASPGPSSAATTSYGFFASSAGGQTDNEVNPVELGVEFRSNVDGIISGVRYYRSPGNVGPHDARLWGPSGQRLASSSFTQETSAGWQTTTFASPVALKKGELYVASYRAPQGRYASAEGAFSNSRPLTVRDLTALRGVYSYDNKMPSRSWRDSNYFVDVIFTPKGSSAASSTPSPTSPMATPSAGPSTTTVGVAKGCAAKPSACGYPDASNTGVGVGANLVKSGCITARTAGQVIQNVFIDGCSISVEAPNVTIRNVKMSQSAVDSFAIIVRPGASARIENVEIAGLNKGIGSVQYAILSQTSSSVIVDRANLYQCADCIQGENMTITNSYIHDMANPPGAHVDGFQCNSSCGSTLRHNTIFNEWGQTAAIAFFADFGTPRNSIVEDNLLAGGGYTVYGGTDNASGIRIINNRFARQFSSKSGQYGHGTAFNRTANGNTWSGNTWDDTGSTVPAP